MWLITPLAIYGLVLACLSDGNYHDDDTLHYLCSRHAWEIPRIFLGVWARPGFTVPYALVAWIGDVYTGLFCSRLLSLALVIAGAALTSVTARRLQIPNAEWAGFITLLIPLHFQLSITTLTETICSVYLIAATWLFVADRPRLSALVLSLTLVTRHEAILFVIGGALLFSWRRQWGAALLVSISELVWNALAIWTDNPERPWRRYLPGSDLGYGSGGLLSGLFMWIEMAGPVAIVLTLWGSVRLLRGEGLREVASPFASDLGAGDFPLNPRGALLDGSRIASPVVGRFLVVAGALGIVALNTLLYMFNRFASGGYARFLVPASPWMAICILHALNAAVPELLRCFELPFRRSQVGLVAAFLLMPVLTLVAYGIHPDRQQVSGTVTYFLGLNLFWLAGTVVLIGCWSRSFRLLTISPYLFAAIWGLSWSGGALPLAETLTQRLHGEACRWIAAHPEWIDQPVACLSPVGDIHTEQWGLRRASIWLEPSPGRPILLLDDRNIDHDAPLKARLQGLRLTEVVRFPIAPSADHDARKILVVHRAEVVPAVTTASASR